jgi:predicted transcriptional regulator
MNSNPYLEQAMEMVKAQAGVKQMTPVEIVEMAREIAEGLKNYVSGTEDVEPVTQEPFIEPKRAIRLNHIICVECGAKFKILSKKHIASHGLTPDEYREKWGYKKGTSLVCKSVTQKRREKIVSTKIWTKASKNSKSRKSDSASKSDKKK